MGVVVVYLLDFSYHSITFIIDFNLFLASDFFLYPLGKGLTKEKIGLKWINCLSGNHIKWSNTLKQFVGNSVLDHFVGSAPERLNIYVG